MSSASSSVIEEAASWDREGSIGAVRRGSNGPVIAVMTRPSSPGASSPQKASAVAARSPTNGRPDPLVVLRRDDPLRLPAGQVHRDAGARYRFVRAGPVPRDSRRDADPASHGPPELSPDETTDRRALPDPRGRPRGAGRF